jgi:hypothetical protein
MRRLVHLLPLLLLAAGCVRSLYPLYTDEQLICDQALGGIWRNAETRESLDITPLPADKSYKVKYTDKEGKSGPFVVHLAKVQDTLLADMAPDELDDTRSDVYNAHLLPLHSFMIVELAGNTLRLRTMKDDWFKEHIKAHPEALGFVQVEDEYLLASAPRQAQEFLLRNLKTEGAYSDPTEFERIPATTRP